MLSEIHIDATYSLDRKPTGVANYSREILFGLANGFPATRFGFCYRPHRFRRSFAEALPRNARRHLLADPLLPLAPRLFHGLNQRLPNLRIRRAVSTFHDLFVLTSEYSTQAFRERFTLQAKDAASRSDAVICVSAFTASQVEELLHVPPSRIRVIHHGVRRPEPAQVPPVDQREPLILFVGAIQKRKNVHALVLAFAHVAPPWRLVLVGEQGYGCEEVDVAIAESPARERITKLGYCDPDTLRSLYASASVFAFPSLDEGFGMPVLEAMAWGVPVLCSNRSSMPEVAGDAALLVDPGCQSDIQDALMFLTSSERERSRLASLGMARVADFTWDKAISETYALYETLGD